MPVAQCWNGVDSGVGAELFGFCCSGYLGGFLLGVIVAGSWITGGLKFWFYEDKGNDLCLSVEMRSVVDYGWWRRTMMRYCVGGAFAIL